MSNLLYKASFISTVVVVLAFSTKSQASRLDTRFSTFMLDINREQSSINFMPGLGIGYDCRNPVSRPGWSVVPMLLVGSYPRKDAIDSLLFPAVVARYRYYFNKQLSVDGNIGGGLLAVFTAYTSLETVVQGDTTSYYSKLAVRDVYIPAPFLSLGFNYTFANQTISGIDIMILYSTESHQIAPLVNILTSFPIAGSKQQLGRRR